MAHSKFNQRLLRIEMTKNLEIALYLEKFTKSERVFSGEKILA